MILKFYWKKKADRFQADKLLLSAIDIHGADVSNEDDRVAAVATTLWTEEVVAAYQAAQEETPAE